MKKLFCIAILLLSGMLIVPVDGGAVGPAKPPVWTNTNKLENVKPTVTDTRPNLQSTVKEDQRKGPSIAFKSATITRTPIGTWHWEVRIKATQNLQVKPNTALLKVWQNAGGKKTLLASNVYDRPICPSEGILQNDFYPSGSSDTLDFELIELKPSTEGAKSKSSKEERVKLTKSTLKIVDRATVAVPPFDIRLAMAGYQHQPDPAHLYALVQNKSPLPMSVQVVMKAGDHQHWTTVRHRETVLLPGGNSETRIVKDWTFTEKGGGFYLITVEAQLKDPATGEVKWIPIQKKEGNLPVF